MHIGIPSQFTKVHDEWIRPAPRIISVIRVRASRGNDSAVFHLHVGMPTQFRRVRDDWTRRNRASSASSGSRLPHNMIPQSVPHQHHPGQGRASPHKDCRSFARNSVPVHKARDDWTRRHHPGQGFPTQCFRSFSFVYAYRSQFTRVPDEWIRPELRIISIIRVRACSGNDSAVFHLQGNSVLVL